MDHVAFTRRENQWASIVSPGGPIGPGGPGRPGAPSEPVTGDPGGPGAPGIPGTPESPGQRCRRNWQSAHVSLQTNQLILNNYQYVLSLVLRCHNDKQKWLWMAYCWLTSERQYFQVLIQNCIVPLEPGAPSIPGRPGKPGLPGNPESPFAPIRPLAPGTPGKPGGPGKPNPGSPYDTNIHMCSYIFFFIYLKVIKTFHVTMIDNLSDFT